MPGNSDVVVSNRPFEVGVRYAQLSILELINAQLRLLVGHIEQIGSEMERRPLTDFVAIVGVEVSISSCRRTAQSPMAFGRSLATVLVNRMSSQVVNRNPGLDTDSGSQRQVLCEAVREGVAEEIVKDVTVTDRTNDAIAIAFDCHRCQRSISFFDSAWEEPLLPTFCRAARLHLWLRGSDVFRLEAFRSLGDIEFDRLAFL